MARQRTDLTELSYDYAQLPESVREAVRAHAVGIRAALARSAESVIEIGQRLCEARNLFAKYHDFTSWCEAEFGLSESSVSRFMRVWERFGAIEVPAGVSVSVLYELAALPEGEAERAIREGIGEKKISQVTKDEIQSYRRAVQERDEKIAALESEQKRLESEVGTLREQLKHASSEKLAQLKEQIAKRDEQIAKLKEELAALKQQYTSARMLPSDEEKRLWEAEMHMRSFVSCVERLVISTDSDTIMRVQKIIQTALEMISSLGSRVAGRGYIDAEKVS